LRGINTRPIHPFVAKNTKAPGTGRTSWLIGAIFVLHHNTSDLTESLILIMYQITDKNNGIDMPENGIGPGSRQRL
jgi:hypothetical protein